MLYRRSSFLVAILAAVFMTVAPSLAEQGPTAEARIAKKQQRAGKAKKKNTGKKGKKGKRARRGKRSSGHNVKQANLPSTELQRPSGNVWVFSENMHEEVKVNIYDEDGEFNDEALAKLDHEFRCRRTREERAVDPRLYEMLSRIQDHFGGKRIHLVSGFRFQRNEGSRHYHASAMDIRIPGVSIRKLRAYAHSLDRGGMGIGLYPKSNFVHVDFRAPGQPSYRWVDRSGPGKGNQRGKRRSRRFKRRAPNS
jgi:uncharacterized protein YcbK (DUF882 family)